MTINNIGSLDWSQVASQTLQKRNTENGSRHFALDDCGTDTADISAAAKNLAQQHGFTGQVDQSYIQNMIQEQLGGQVMVPFSIFYKAQSYLATHPNGVV